MTESLKRVSIVLLALAITLGLTGVITLGITKNVGATPEGKVFVCKYVGIPGVDERLQTGDNPISVSINAIKDYQGVGSYFNDKQGRSFVVALDEGQPEPECPTPDEPEFKYNFTFDKLWKGDKIDESKVDVSLSFTFKNKEYSIAEGQYAKVKKNSELTNLKETVTGLPANCTYKTDLPESYVAFPKEKKEVDLQSVRENGQEPKVDVLTVTNTVTCTKTPVTPEGETETPVTTVAATQVTVKPTGAVDAGAGADVIASLAGLMGSAAVVAGGLFLRRFSVVSL